MTVLTVRNSCLAIPQVIAPVGIKKGIFFSFPCYCPGNGTFEIVPHFPWSSFGEPWIERTKKELYEEWVL